MRGTSMKAGVVAPAVLGVSLVLADDRAGSAADGGEEMAERTKKPEQADRRGSARRTRAQRVARPA